MPNVSQPDLIAFSYQRHSADAKLQRGEHEHVGNERVTALHSEVEEQAGGVPERGERREAEIVHRVYTLRPLRILWREKKGRRERRV